eukprot:CAMPEP_0206259844 /NCGR_PEP_ID=MMETSP0047_2-20121206/26724_1 /ASSEMBLY_ACC=CAM_ASM_000192 /TAXON_ID=195065 /ORGANISM="Chroomonas mesostigmatica_cf, Strain CCMP1168" /LENGTH=61 /DNA_ID=CAMNT_0053686791 /DNA_START=1 /DNA_END=184 /DNA_ORIENTATION=-
MQRGGRSPAPPAPEGRGGHEGLAREGACEGAVAPPAAEEEQQHSSSIEGPPGRARAPAPAA